VAEKRQLFFAFVLTFSGIIFQFTTPQAFLCIRLMKPEDHKTNVTKPTQILALTHFLLYLKHSPFICLSLSSFLTFYLFFFSHLIFLNHKYEHIMFIKFLFYFPQILFESGVHSKARVWRNWRMSLQRVLKSSCGQVLWLKRNTFTICRKKITQSKYGQTLR